MAESQPAIDAELVAEPLTEAAVDEVLQFFRAANPFAQKVWGWDTGRFVDWRWGGNAIVESASPGWFASNGTLYRTEGRLRAVAIAEYGGRDMCVITPHPDTEVVGEVVRRLVDRGAANGVVVRFEAAESANWLSRVFADCGLVEQQDTGCEWEYDLADQIIPTPVPDGFAVGTLAEDDSPEVYSGIAECVRRAFETERDLLPTLRSLAGNPFFRPELSVFVRSSDGRIAAYCRGTVDPENGVCGIDPVCADPDFQRLGLSKAVVRACFRRQHRLGGRFSYIGSAPEPAPGTFLYRSLGPASQSVSSIWSSPSEASAPPSEPSGPAR